MAWLESESVARRDIIMRFEKRRKQGRPARAPRRGASAQDKAAAYWRRGGVRIRSPRAPWGWEIDNISNLTLSRPEGRERLPSIEFRKLSSLAAALRSAFAASALSIAGARVSMCAGSAVLLCLAGAALAAEAQPAATPKPGEVFRDCADCGEMVVVPRGEFDMGSRQAPSEAPEHHVAIAKPFAIGRREVTFAEWDRLRRRRRLQIQPQRPRLGPRRPAGDRPQLGRREGVHRLAVAEDRPSPIACRARRNGNMRRAAAQPRLSGGGATSAPAGPNARIAAATRAQTAPTGSFRPNAFGLYDTPATPPNGCRIAGIPLIAARRATARPG